MSTWHFVCHHVIFLSRELLQRTIRTWPNLRLRLMGTALQTPYRRYTPSLNKLKYKNYQDHGLGNGIQTANNAPILYSINNDIRNRHRDYTTAKIRQKSTKGRGNLTKAPVRHTLQPLCDLSATKIHNDRRGRRGVATRSCSWSATGRRLIGDWLPTDRRPRGDLFATWCNCTPTGRGPVPD